MTASALRDAARRPGAPATDRDRIAVACHTAAPAEPRVFHPPGAVRLVTPAEAAALEARRTAPAPPTR